jgi:hypothetical protein
MPFIDEYSMGRCDLEILFIGHLYDSFLCMKDWVDRDGTNEDDLAVYAAYLTILESHLTCNEYAAMINHLTVEKGNNI